MSVLPLVLMWLWSLRPGGSPASPSPTTPRWPTPSSPPPMPAFVPQPPYVPAQPTPSSEHGTPLATLHTTPPAPAHAAAPHPTATASRVKPKPKPRAPTPASAASAALKAARGELPGGLKLPGFSFSSGDLTVKTVGELQAIVNMHGGKLARDGKYGPKTASAWTALAKRKGLPSTISRNGPTTAKISTHTFESLSIPPIP